LKNLRLFLILFSLCSASFLSAGYKDYIYQDRNSSYNSLGQTGLIYTPSAEIGDEGSIFFTVNKSDIWKLGTLTVTPFNWMEASYFYYRPDDLSWDAAGSNVGLYLDKGFNMKFGFEPKNNNLPSIALGLDDFAGTGQFSREYIASTLNGDSYKFTFGMGWGKFVGDDSYRNPLYIIDDSFRYRAIAGGSGQGGQLESSKWFRGPVSYFGGFEWFIPHAKGLKLKVELDPFDYFDFSCCGDGESSQSYDLRKKKSDINYGLSMPLKGYGNIDISFIKGNTINVSISLGATFKEGKPRKKSFKPKLVNNNYSNNKKEEFYRDLLENLNSNKIYLQTANIKQKNLSITIDSPDIINPIRSSSRAALIAHKIADLNEYNFERIDVGTLFRGAEINNINYDTRDLNTQKNQSIELIARNTSIAAVNPSSYKKDEFKPLVSFPIIINGIAPSVRSHVGSPEKFYYGGIGVDITSEIQFSRELSLMVSIGKDVRNNFDRKSPEPNSDLPHVRTEIVSYLQGSTEYINHLQLDYIFSPLKQTFVKLSAGIFEQMYGGYGAEILYTPFNKNISFGYESYNVKRRTYDGKFEFFDYQVITDHFNINYYEPKLNILAKWSYGNYLAGDQGYTLDLSRKMKSGWRAGFFFTRTDVSFAQFGEGSFDKGFYFKIPNDLIFKNYSKASTSFGLKTMTRDGGQKLDLQNLLTDLFFFTNKNDIQEQWNGFAN